MALSILDGNQSATTLSTIVTSGQHIPAHTVVSIGTQAITDISGAISGSTVCVGNLGLLQSTVATEGLSASGSFIKIGGHTGTSTTGNIVHVSAVGALRVDGSVYTQPVSIASVTIGNTVTIAGTVTANPTGTQTIAGTVTANGGNFTQSIFDALDNYAINFNERFPVYAVIDPLPAGTNRIGVVTIGAGTVTIGAGTAQIGSVTASISGAVTVGGFSSVSVGSGALLAGGLRGAGVVPLSIDVGTGYLQTKVESLPALVAGTAQIGSVTASISNSVTIGSLPAISGTVTANVGSILGFNEIYLADADNDQRFSSSYPFPISGTVTVGNSVTIASLPAISGTVTANLSISATVITSGSFTSLTSATLVPANTARKMATVYNLGAGQLFINAGATATTLGGGFMVALSSGDFYECDYTTTTLSAIFATAGTASWMSH